MRKLKQHSRYKKETKEARIHIRVTAREKELLQLKAQASGMSLGKFLIAAGLNLKSTRVTPASDKSLYLELCRQGNDLNQLTRLQNTQAASGKGSELDPDDRATLENLRTLLNQILTELQGRAAN